MAKSADPLRSRGEDIHLLASFISSSKNLEHVPTTFVRVMESGAWQHWKNELGRDVHPVDFREFVETKYPSGLGTTLDVLRKIIAGDPRALDLYDQAMQRKPGQHEGNQYTERTGTVDNINGSDRPDGTSEAYALRKLRKDAPEIHAEVLEGDISPHAGMVKAGFRKQYIQVRPTVDSFISAIQKHFGPDEIERIRDGL